MLQGEALEEKFAQFSEARRIGQQRGLEEKSA